MADPAPIGEAPAEASVRDATATTSASGRSTRSAVNAAAIPPVARTPHRTFSPAIAAPAAKAAIAALTLAHVMPGTVFELRA